MNVDVDVDDLNRDETGIYINWNSILEKINEADCPIDEKIEDLNKMFSGLKKYKSGAGKAFYLIGRNILTAKIELIKRQKKRNEEEEKRKRSTAAFKIQGMYKTKKAKKKRCNLKIRKILDEHLRDKVSKPLKKLEEQAFKKPLSTEFKIQTEPQGSLLKPDGTYKIPKAQLYALSKEQQDFWRTVYKEVLDSPPGFKHVKPTGKPPYDKDGKPIGGRRKKTKRRKRRKRRKTCKRRAKSRRKRRTKIRTKRRKR